MRENFNDSGVSLFSIFDGHGGDSVAEFCREKLVENICNKILEVKRFSAESIDDVTKNEISENKSELEKFLRNGNDVDYEKILTSEILIADQKIVDDLRSQDRSTGSTAVIAVIDGPKLTVANVGDSRAIMGFSNGTAVPLSFDHKPDGESEKARIEKAGGFVTFWGVWRVNGILATSRAIGDFFLKPNLVIANPDVLKFDLAQDQ